jgi:hypothetical protein
MSSKRVKVADFARYLLAREGDERGEQIIAETKPGRNWRRSRRISCRAVRATGFGPTVRQIALSGVQSTVDREKISPEHAADLSAAVNAQWNALPDR